MSGLCFLYYRRPIVSNLVFTLRQPTTGATQFCAAFSLNFAPDNFGLVLDIGVDMLAVVITRQDIDLARFGAAHAAINKRVDFAFFFCWLLKIGYMKELKHIRDRKSGMN